MPISLECCVVSVPLFVAEAAAPAASVENSVDAVGHNVYPSGLIEIEKESLRKLDFGKSKEMKNNRKQNCKFCAFLLKYEVNKIGIAIGPMAEENY